MSMSDTSSAIARGHELQVLIDEVYEKCLPHSNGEVATYIPELSKADPEAFGVCVVTADGRAFEAGDCDRAFTIQSISKPFTYGMALEEFGRDKVFEHVGVEPSGDAFNSIELQNGTNRPFNPMVNSGAITVTALLHARHGDRDVRAPARSVQRDRRAPADVDRARVRVRAPNRSPQSCHRPSAAELRHGARRSRSGAGRLLQAVRDPGHLPRPGDDGGHAVEHGAESGQRAQCLLDHPHVKDMLSIMFTCGMYDYSGQWAYRVGVPAKSGVSGGVIAVVNRQLGIAHRIHRGSIAYGNSCRGIEVCVELASRLGLHVFDCLNVGSSFLDAIL